MPISQITLTDDQIDAIADVLTLDGFFVSQDTMPRQCVTGKPCISGIETPDGTSDAGTNEPTRSPDWIARKAYRAAKKDAPRKRNSNFGKRSPTYICGECGKRTRDTGEGESDTEMCLRCFTFRMIENAVSDGNMTEDEEETARADFDAKHKRVKTPLIDLGANVRRELQAFA